MGDWWQVLLGAVVGVILVFVVIPLLLVTILPLFGRWRRHRRYAKMRPPKGTRPEVRVHYDGVVYDVTDSLVRTIDDERNHAVWVVCDLVTALDPDRSSEMRVDIRNPVPRDTRVDLAMTLIPGTHTGRFMTADEVAEKRGLYPS